MLAIFRCLAGVIKKDRSADESGSAKSGEAITKVVQPAAMSMEKQHANQTVSFAPY